MGDHQRFRLDDLRRFGIAVAGAVGVAPARASAFVSGLLWYDAADAPGFGIATLPDWTGAIEAGEVDPKAEGVVGKEYTATAVLDGRRGIGPLILRRAAEIAQEKAREVGAGVVRVVNLGRVGALAEVAAEIAIGPMVGTVAGSMGLAVAVPVGGSVPAVYDSSLDPKSRPGLPPWADGADGWLVTARAAAAIDSLATVHEHVASLLKVDPPSPGEVRPDAWQARRLDHIENGLPLDADIRGKLAACGERLGVAFPDPWAEA